MYDIITFGSAVQDVFLKSKNFKVKDEKKFFNGKGLCISFGSKVSIEEIEFLSGGGGTNVAFTFKNQGLKTAYCGIVGEDSAGREIKEELKKNNISTEFVYLNKKKHTNYSVILATKNERTILAYRGASDELKAKDIPWKKMKSKWFYIAPLYGKSVDSLEKILKFAKKNGIKIAMNPGKDQLSLPRKKLKRLLGFVDVLILNQEEASLATNLRYNEEKKIFKTLDDWVGGICIMTKGNMGATISDNNYLYEIGVLQKKGIIDRTGCGDAFGSGFVMGIIKSYSLKPKTYCLNSKDIEGAIQFGSSNATSCIFKLGAKNGLLQKKESIWKLGKVKIKKAKIKDV